MSKRKTAFHYGLSTLIALIACLTSNPGQIALAQGSASNDLKTPPDLPYLPKGPGTFHDGKYSKYGNFERWNLNYDVPKSTPDQAFSAYQQAVTGSGWSLPPSRTHTEGTFLNAVRMKDGLTLIVTTGPGSKSGDARVTLRYIKRQQ